MNIEIIHLSKQYSNGVIALDDISFTVGSGVFGLLGHNGAGKSTLMKALVTVLKPSSGTVKVCGFDTKPREMRCASASAICPRNLPCTRHCPHLTS